MKRIICLSICLFASWSLYAQKKEGEAASIKNVEIRGEIKPGATVTALIDVIVEKDYQVQSHKPSNPDLVPTLLTLNPPRGVKAGSIKYPEGKTEKDKGPVYEKQFQISVPLGISMDAVLPLKVPATLRCQACKAVICYRPQELKFEIGLNPAGPKK